MADRAVFAGRSRTGNTARFVLDGREHQVAIATPALLDILIGRVSYLRLVPGAVTGRRVLWARLFDPDDAFDLPDAEEVCEGVIAALTGWPAHSSYALAGLLHAQWAVISARATAGGVDLMALPAHRVLDFAYGLWIENADAEERRKIDALLAPPLPALRRRAKAAEGASRTAGATRDSPPPGFSVGEQRESFLAASAAIAGAGPTRT